MTLVAKLTQLVEQLRVGPGLGQSPENEMGPLISKGIWPRCVGLVDQGGGRRGRATGRWSHAEPRRGLFYRGCLFDEVTPGCDLPRGDLRPVLSSCGCRITRRRCASSTSTSTATAPPSFTATRHRRGTSGPGAGRYGRGERSHSGADGVSQLWRLEALHLRAAQHARAGRGSLLYPDEDVDGRAGPRVCAVVPSSHADHEVTCWRVLMA